MIDLHLFLGRPLLSAGPGDADAAPSPQRAYFGRIPQVGRCETGGVETFFKEARELARSMFRGKGGFSAVSMLRCVPGCMIRCSRRPQCLPPLSRAGT